MTQKLSGTACFSRRFLTCSETLCSFNMLKQVVPAREVSDIWIFTLIMALLVAGCTPVQRLDDSLATPQGVAEAVHGNNQFAFALYDKLKGGGDNVFFSPFSISSVLAMTYEGAEGKTAEEMTQVFGFSSNDTPRRAAFASLYNRLNAKERDYKLSVANALWAQQDYPFLESYHHTILGYYGGEVTNLDFGQSEKARGVINGWVEDHTNDKIKDIIGPGILGADTRLVLTNAIYFKGDWAVKFDQKNTRDADFWVNPATTVKVPLMSLTGEKAKFPYAETDTLQVLELPYQGNEISMVVLLPKEGYDLSATDQYLTSENFGLLMGSLREQEINVFLPKFKMEQKYSLPEPLKQMGMVTAFSDKGDADFSGMDGTKNLYIGNVIHQSFVEVNEEGTEAAAATVVVVKMATGIAQQRIFRTDHPFIFLIQEKQTGAILFMGKMGNPADS